MNSKRLKDSTISLLVIDGSSSLTEKIKFVLNGNASISIYQNFVTGTESINIVSSCNPDFVIINSEMNSMDIGDLTHAIQHQTRSKILMVCDSVEEIKIKNIMSSGANGIILSSSIQCDLLCALQTIQNGDHFFSPSIEKSIVVFYLKQTIDENIESYLLS